MGSLVIVIYSDSEFSPLYTLLHERKIMERRKVPLVFFFSSDIREKSNTFLSE
jgi:hypothetical protein